MEHSVEWQEEFLRVKKDMIHATHIQQDRIEHIGSTAIKGIVAKPILDLLVGVDDIENVEKNIFQGLKKVGFLRLRVQRPDEIILAKFKDDTYEIKTHYIHMVEYNKDLWRSLIFFRDYLNTHQAAREEYQQLKMQFTKQNKSGIDDYTNYKERFVKEIIGRKT